MTVWTRTAGRSPPPDGTPFALVERRARGLTLRALNAAARAGGLRAGQRHADARAILPRLLSAPAEPAREADALAALARWCERWSPTVALDAAGSAEADGREGLLLDVTGVAHLFGGEAGMLRAMRSAFRRMAVPVRLALAETPGAAWGLARYAGGESAIVPPGQVRAALAPLPLAALRLGDETLALARRFGLKRVEDLYAMPRAGLARRFRAAEGMELVARLDRALGVEPDPLMPLRALPRFRVVARFAEPLMDKAGVAAALDSLCAELVAQLEAEGQGARALSIAGFRADGGVPTLTVRLGRPSRRVAVWRRLFAERGLERLDLGFGIDALGLAADEAEPLVPAQPALDGGAACGERFQDVIDRLVARLGERAVRVPLLRESWLPERAVRWVPAQGAEFPAPGAFDRARPLLLLDPPEPVKAGLFVIPDGAPTHFTWRRVTRRVTRAEGPERLAPVWWQPGRGAARLRDYYRIEDEQGIRYWLYREGVPGGESLPGGEAGPAPGWWMHGLFA